MRSQTFLTPGLLSLLAALAFLMGCATSKHETGNDGLGIRSIPHNMFELDTHGARFPNTNNAVETVDAHSTLVMHFTASKPAGDTTGVPPDWAELNNVLDYLSEHSDKRAKLATRFQKLARGDKAGEQVFWEDARRLNEDAGALLRDLRTKIGLTQSEIRDILNGRAKGIGRPSEDGYVNLAQWATNRWGEKREEMARDIKKVEMNSLINVTVQATRRSPTTGASGALHINGWDNLAEGAYSPIDRTGFRPTEAEAKRLDAQRKAAEAGVVLVRSIQTNGAKMDESFQKVLRDLEKQVDQLGNQVLKAAEGWSNGVDASALTSLLNGVADGQDVEQAKAAKEILGVILRFQTNYIAATNLVANAKSLSESLQNLKGKNAVDLMFGTDGMAARMGQMIADATALGEQVRQWPDRFKTLHTAAPKMTGAAKVELERVLVAAVTNALETLRQDMPEEVKAATDLWAAARVFFSGKSIGEIMDSADTQLIAHRADNLPDARLNLKFAGIALGDSVFIKLRATNSATGALVHEETYEHEVGLIGFHGKPSVSLIFARALSGDSEATDWKPNVSAAVECHYTIRRPTGPWGKLWNKAYPGIGIHVANLDQGEDSVEVGTGINISFLDGLIAGGFGWNFSNSKHPEYVYVGVNLLNVFGAAKDKMFGR